MIPNSQPNYRKTNPVTTITNLAKAIGRLIGERQAHTQKLTDRKSVEETPSK